MKKIVFLSLFCLQLGTMSAITQREVSKDNINQTIISVHTRVFGVNDLFKEKIDDIDAIKWHEMLQEVQKFVTENSKGNKLLLNYLEEAILDGYILINNTRRIYSMVFQEKVKNSVAWAKKQLTQLEKRKKAIIRNDKNLKSRIFTGNQKQAKEILTTLLLVLELTTNKLIKDFNKDLVRIAIK